MWTAASAALTPELRKLLDHALALPEAKPASDAVVADAMQYSIAVEAPGSARELHFDDVTLPPVLVPLLAYLTAASKPMPLA